MFSKHTMRPNLNAFGHNLGTVDDLRETEIQLSARKNGAGDEIRTHDFNLGKVALYP